MRVSPPDRHARRNRLPRNPARNRPCRTATRSAGGRDARRRRRRNSLRFGRRRRPRRQPAVCGRGCELPYADAQRVEALPGDALRRRRRRRALSLHQGAGGAALREPFRRAAARRCRGRHAGRRRQHGRRAAMRDPCPGFLRRARRRAPAAAVFAARPQLLRKAQRNARLLCPVRSAQGELPRFRSPPSEGDPARGCPFHVDPRSGARGRHRRLLRAQLRGASGKACPRLCATGRSPQRPSSTGTRRQCWRTR